MNESFHLIIPARHRYLKLASGLITEILSRESRVHYGTIYNIELAVQEIAANIVDHAYTEDVEGRITIEIVMNYSPRSIMIYLHDTGHAFNPAQVAPPNAEDAQIRGYGLHLAHKLMDEVTYEAREDGNHWRLTKNL